MFPSISRISSLLLNKRGISSGLALGTAGCLAKVGYAYHTFKKETLLQEVASFCRKKLEQLHLPHSKWTRDPYYLKETFNQKSVQTVLEEISNKLSPFSKDRRIQPICAQVLKCSQTLDGKSKVIGDKEGVNVVREAHAYVRACTHRGCLLLEKDRARRKKKQNWMVEGEKKSALFFQTNKDLANQELKEGILRELLAWLAAYPSKNKKKFDLTPPQLKELKELKAWQFQQSFNLLRREKLVRKSAENLHQLWKILAYPQPIILKNATLLDPICRALEEENFVLKQEPSYKLLLFSAFACAMGSFLVGKFA